MRSRAAASSIMPDDASSTSTCDSAARDARAHVVVHAERDREHGAEQDDDVDRPSGSCRRRSVPAFASNAAEPCEAQRPASGRRARCSRGRRAADARRCRDATPPRAAAASRRPSARGRGRARASSSAGTREVERGHWRASADRLRRRRDLPVHPRARTSSPRLPCGAAPAPDRRRARRCTAMSGIMTASSRRLRSGMCSFSGLSSGLKRMR